MVAAAETFISVEGHTGAEGDGSHGNRLRAWKVHLQRLATEVRFPITVCHYQPGTSKGNAIEHRLFSFISMNWKGQPLVSYEAVVNLMSHTRTSNRTHSPGGARQSRLLDRASGDTHPDHGSESQGPCVSSRLELHAVTAGSQSPILIPHLF
jgi:hypothetical protein